MSGAKTRTALGILWAPLPLPATDHRGSRNDKHKSATTYDLATRMRAVADEIRGEHPEQSETLHRAAWKLLRCARSSQERTGWHCRASYCPRCAARTSARYRRSIQAWMKRRIEGGLAPHGFGLLTLTVVADTPEKGHRILTAARSQICRRRLVRDVIRGGEAHVHVEPVRGDPSQWNVHIHAIVELGRPLEEVDLSVLCQVWHDGLRRFGTTGSLDLAQESNLCPSRRKLGKVSL